MHIHSFIFLFLFFSYSFCFNVSCDICSYPIPSSWNPGSQPSCGLNGENYNNSLCLTTLSTINYCFIAFNITGIRYAGSCGCPNNCYENSGYGTCINSKCECNSGWKGEDCSQVDCTTTVNTCSNHGTCEKQYDGHDICICDSNRTGADCSTTITPIPPILQTIQPPIQYSSWDKYDNDHPIFNNSIIAQIKLYMNPLDVEFMLNPLNKETSEYKQADLKFNNGLQVQTIDNIGIRIKGNISRYYAKKNFRLNFNKFIDDDDNDWDQISGMSLKGFQADNSYIRDPMSSITAYSMNVYMQRFGWAQVYINDISYGFYLMLEDVDGKYLKSRFGTNNGPLYKCTANLTYIGYDVTIYENLMCGSSPCYDPKTSEANDYTQLRDLLFIMNLPTNGSFEEELPKIFDVNLFLRSFAWEVATGNWDGLRDSNNFYLFKNPDDGLWKYIRHDNDNTFGTIPDIVNVTTNDIYYWGSNLPGGYLYNKILTVDIFKYKYSVYLQELLNTFYNYKDYTNFRELARSFQYLNIIPVFQDAAHYLDNGFTFTTYNNSFYETFYKPQTPITSGQILTSFIDFMEPRQFSAQKQLTEYFHSINTIK